MNHYTLAGLALVIALTGGLFFSRTGGGQESTASPAEVFVDTNQATVDEVAMDSVVDLEEAVIREFTVVGDNFSFDTEEIVVDKGDTVRIVFQNKEGFHDWVLDEFSARTPVITTGQESVVEFVADQIGEFEYYCSVGDHRAMGMKGTLKVQ